MGLWFMVYGFNAFTPYGPRKGQGYFYLQADDKQGGYLPAACFLCTSFPVGDHGIAMATVPFLHIQISV